MTIIQDLEKLLHEHQELPAAVNGMLLAKDLRELVERYKQVQALQELADRAQDIKDRS